ncbi:MAG: hydrogenase maturation nickel metallochaperone HypA [Candidatus Eisenbacteria bacterium]
MHELSICQSMLEIVDRVMADHSGARLERVFVDVGRGSTVEPSLLGDAFRIATAGGPYEGAELVVNEIPLRGKCRSCGRSFEYKEIALGCPGCESTSVDIESGMELSIMELEIDESGAGGSEPPGREARGESSSDE